MFESLVAFAIIALVVASGLSILGQSAKGQRDRLDALVVTETAFSLMEERIAGNASPQTLSLENGWTWSLFSTSEASDPTHPLPGGLQLTRIEISVTRPDGNTSNPLSTLVLERP